MALKVFSFLILVGIVASSKPAIVQQDLWEQIVTMRGSANVLVSFPQDTGILSKVVNSLSPKVERSTKISAIKSALEASASQSQERVTSFLEKTGVISYSSLWISNQIYIRDLKADLLYELLQFEEITKISLERMHNTFNPVGAAGPLSSTQNREVKAEWGIYKIEAEAANQLLRNVSGGTLPEIRVGILGTGAHATHEAIRDSFLGPYGWYDPHGVYDPPVDVVGVGTHEIGVIAGSNGVGVFPSAKWMACRACADFFCGDYAILRCAEVFTCPLYPNDTLPDCSKAPHVVHGDVWTGPGDDWFDRSLEIWEAAGIIPVWPLGGGGPACSSARYPSESAKVIAVSGTTPEDVWYERSSAGPSMTSGRMKPEMVAPATNILSAYNLDDTTLIPLSATSCASAHVAGVVAILKAYDPNLSFTQILIALARGAQREGLGLSVDDLVCGGIPVTTFPNNIFGFGRLNALGSLNYIIKHF